MTPDEEVAPSTVAPASTSQSTASSSTKPLFNTPGYVANLEKANNLASSSTSNSSASSSKGSFGGFGKAIGSMLTRSKTSTVGPTDKSKNGLMGLQNLVSSLRPSDSAR